MTVKEERLLISIVTPSYNQERYLEECLLSVKEQDYPYLEHIVIDGGSTDNSINILRRYVDQYNLQWVSEPDYGQADAVNKGFTRANGEILGWLNSDDAYAPGTLTLVSDTFSARPECRVVFGGCKSIDNIGEVVDEKQPHDYTYVTLLEGKSLPQPSVFLHRRVLSEIGYLDRSLHYALDWAYFLKIFLSYPSHQLIYVPSVLSASRVYESTKSQTGGIKKAQERRRVLTQYAEQGLLPTKHSTLYRRAWAATYWLQALEVFYNDGLMHSLPSALYAVLHDPSSLVGRLAQVSWAFKERAHRRKNADSTFP